jgi:hypothetical protein
MRDLSARARHDRTANGIHLRVSTDVARRNTSRMQLAALV